jgi:hypothetical protein
VKSFPDTIRELWLLVRTYATQELLTPLKGLGLYLLWGVGGALLVVLGSGIFLLGILRLIQTETVRGQARHGTTALPYLILAVLCVGLIFLLYRRINRQFQKAT